MLLSYEILYSNYSIFSYYHFFQDVQTQAMYQMMDEGFVGLIFATFNQDKATYVSRYRVSLNLYNLSDIHSICLVTQCLQNTQMLLKKSKILKHVPSFRNHA